MSECILPPEGSLPDGTGTGKPWIPRPGATFLTESVLTRSLVAVEPPPPQGVVGIDLQGRWNHGAGDILSLIVHPKVAREWASDLLAAADAAERDEERVRRG
jgi:hypothetical protein